MLKRRNGGGGNGGGGGRGRGTGEGLAREGQGGEDGRRRRRDPRRENRRRIERFGELYEVEWGPVGGCGGSEPSEKREVEDARVAAGGDELRESLVEKFVEIHWKRCEVLELVHVDEVEIGRAHV